MSLKGQGCGDRNRGAETVEGTAPRYDAAQPDGAVDRRGDRGCGPGEKGYRRLSRWDAGRGPRLYLSGQRGGSARNQSADAEYRRYRRCESGWDDLACGGGDQVGHGRGGPVPRRRPEQGRRSKSAGNLSSARVRGAVRQYRCELRLRDDRQSPYLRIRHQAGADGESCGRSAQERAQESAGDFQRQAAHDR